MGKVPERKKRNNLIKSHTHADMCAHTCTHTHAHTHGGTPFFFSLERGNKPLE